MRTLRVILALVAIAIVALLCSAWWRWFQEDHARACLEHMTQLADVAVNDTIPRGEFTEAIEVAEHIESFYPVGTMLQDTHRFASTYTSERQKQLGRIAEALRDATGQDFGTKWSKWAEFIAVRGEHPPRRGRPVAPEGRR